MRARNLPSLISGFTAPADSTAIDAAAMPARAAVNRFICRAVAHAIAAVNASPAPVAFAIGRGLHFRNALPDASAAHTPDSTSC